MQYKTYFIQKGISKKEHRIKNIYFKWLTKQNTKK